MSGGSFDYLCLKESDDFVAFPPERMESMALALLDYGTPEAHAAAKATLRIIARLNVWRDIVKSEIELLKPVWKAVEWHHSCDWGPEHVMEALKEMADG